MIRLGLIAAAIVSVLVWRSSAFDSKPSASEAADRPPAAEPTKAPTPSAAPVASALPKARAPEPRGNQPMLAPVLVAGEDAALPLSGNPEPSPAWPGWRCADVDDGTRRSYWFREDAPGYPAEVYDGSCAEWANRGPTDHELYEEDYEVPYT